MLLLQRCLHLQFGLARARVATGDYNAKIPDEGGSLEDLGDKFAIAVHRTFREGNLSLRKAAELIPAFTQIAWDEGTEYEVEQGYAGKFVSTLTPNTMWKCCFVR